MAGKNDKNAKDAANAQSTCTAEKHEDKRSVKTKAAIKNAFIELSQDHSFENISVSEIARVADINRKTFYCHYVSLEELIDEIIYDDAEQFISSLKGATLTSEGGIDVNALYEVMCVNISTRLVNEASIISNVNIGMWIKAVERTYVREILKNKLFFADGFNAEQVRFSVLFIISGLLTTLQVWLSEDSELELSALSEMMSSAAVGAVEGLNEYQSLNCKS